MRIGRLRQSIRFRRIARWRDERRRGDGGGGSQRQAQCRHPCRLPALL